jgi:hypothetical protein
MAAVTPERNPAVKFQRSGSASLLVLPGIVNVLDIVLDPAGAIQGTVRDEEGQPVPKVRVARPVDDPPGFFWVESDANGFYRFETAASGRDQIFDYNYSSVGPYYTFNLVTHAMFFGAGADINQGQTHFLGNQSCLGYACCSYAGDDIYLAQLLANGLRQHLADVGPDFRVGKRNAVVAINGRIPSRGPFERLVG